VDCGDVDQIVPYIKGALCGILLTHGHFDHIYGLNQLLNLYPDVPVYTNDYGLETLYDDKLNFSKFYGNTLQLQPVNNIRILHDGDEFELFDGVNVHAVFTPGHSPCCVTWVLDDMMFTGDSYIPGVKTVTNLPHCDKKQAACSEILIKKLAEHRTVYPGHAPESMEIL
jgi:glyoxylase-like metal-dependent hydrolase (beta-lactamase superfamily II)